MLDSDPIGDTTDTPELAVSLIAPAANAVLPDPVGAPTVRVRFSVSSRFVNVDTRQVEVGAGTGFLAATREGTTNVWYVDAPVAAQWPSIRITAQVRGRATLVGQTGPVEATSSITVSVDDASSPELTPAPLAFTDSGSGFLIRVEATVRDHTSGIDRIEWSLNAGALAAEPIGSAPRVALTWRRDVLTSVIGANSLRVRVVDRKGWVTERTLPITTKDTTPPNLQVLMPTQDQVYVVGTTGAQVQVTGTAADAQSGMVAGLAAVEWSLNGRLPFTRATTSSNWANWQAVVPIADYGYHTIHIRATDRDGNSTKQLVNVQVVSSYRPKDTEELLSVRAYLDALLEFCRNHMTVPGEGPLSTSKLEEVFRQPFGVLKEPLSASGSKPVNALRVAIEVLRRHLVGEPKVLVAHWRADENGGTTLADASGSGNNGTLANGATWAPGKFGTALSLTAPTQRAQAPHKAAIELGKNGADFSVAFWIRIQAAPTGVWRLVARKGTEPERTFAMFLHPTENRIHFRISVEGNPNLGGDSVTRIDANAWTHIAYVKTGDALRLYINGLLDAEVSLGGKKPVSNLGPLTVGSDGTLESFRGLVDDFRVYQTALTDDSVATLASEDGGTLVAPMQADYLLAVYQAMLARMGTSYAEIRLARGAPAAVRGPLSDRLGVTARAAGSNPDDLDALFKAPAALTEAWLEDTFGIAKTTRLLTDAPAARPALLVAQENRLRAAWRTQDDPATATDLLPTPVIDPDLVAKDDFVDPSPGNAAFDLWQARKSAADAKFHALNALRAAQPTPSDGFTTIVANVLGVMADIPRIEAAMAAGVDVTATLAGLDITAREFAVLARVRALAAAGTITTTEWDETCHLLVQAWKRKQDGAWRSEELLRQVSLGPRFFRLDGRGARRLPWRTSAETRRRWIERLRSRSEQERGLLEGLDANVAASEEAALPVLRDALVASVGGVELLQQTADRLSERLLADVNSAGAIVTTRILQAIETIHGIVFAWRTGRFSPENPASTWAIVEEGATTAAKEQNFDAEWEWMGSYSQWRSAMTLFLYPENLLLPHLRELAEQSRPFVRLVAKLRSNSRLSPGEARLYAQEYRDEMVAAFPDPAFSWVSRFNLTDQLSTEQLLARRDEVAGLWAAGGLPLRELAYYAPMEIAWFLQRAGQFPSALDWIQTVYAYNLPRASRKIYAGLALEVNNPPVLTRTQHWTRTGLNPHAIAATRPNAHTRYTLMSLADCLIEFGDSQFARDTNEAVAEARAIYMVAREILGLPELVLKKPTDAAQVLLPNPRLARMQMQAEAQLLKIRQGRNIAGMRRQVELVTDAAPATLPSLGATARALDPPASLRPTPYRFSVLLERGKQLTGLAQQIEVAYLAALERLDAGRYDEQKARFDLELASAGVELQRRRRMESERSRQLARQQRERSELQVRQYDELLAAGLSRHERDQLEETLNAFRWGIASAAVSSLGAMIGGVAGGIAGAAAGNPVTMATTAGIGAVLGALSGGLGGVSQTFSGISGAYGTHAQFRGIQASYERRAQQWENERSLASHDVAIGVQHEQLAEDQTYIVSQEQAIARLQESHARAGVDFLATKFLNIELYEWMSGVLGGIYRYFLQQASATAKLAENQLLFERQQRFEAFIRSDYWASPGGASGASDRRGLTGSARLLQDIVRLDEYAFQTNTRKLNLSQTFSLAELVPLELQRFRETGVLRFNTPGELFDRSFPGHYLRLIRRVRTSIVALIPPVRGISASLSTPGISRVVLGEEGSFREAIVWREPEMVALTSPNGATGVFELDAQSEMLLPFESMGVDTTWELQLPRAANAFDFRTIADVLFTIDYTALNAMEYRRQVLERLDRQVGGQYAISLRNQYPDQWYALSNAPAGTAVTLSLALRREFLPPGLSALAVESLVLYVAPSQEVQRVGATFAELQFPMTGSTPARQSAGSAASLDGIISTRRGSWLQVVGATPCGEWQLTVADAVMLQQIRAGEVDDIVLVLGYRAERPSWP
jgi:hypothetical protein